MTCRPVPAHPLRERTISTPALVTDRRAAHDRAVADGQQARDRRRSRAVGGDAAATPRHCESRPPSAPARARAHHGRAVADATPDTPSRTRPGPGANLFHIRDDEVKRLVVYRDRHAAEARPRFREPPSDGPRNGGNARPRSGNRWLREAMTERRVPTMRAPCLK
jgi:hypothetical protein